MDKKVYQFISEKTFDPIVEWKTCAVSGKTFAIFQSDINFYDKISPIFNGVKYPIPTPTLCPEERQRRRLMFRNERKLYKRKCDLTGKEIISIYSPDKPYKVYDQASRRSDKRDPMDYGRDYDFSKTFTENFTALNKEIPKQALAIRESENCDYTNLCGFSKNCYMLFAGSNNEECFYSKHISKSTNSMDILMGESLSGCYECVECKNCSNVYYSRNSIDCSFSRNLDTCIDCQYCYACNNLAHKKYCIYNEQLTKEAYETRLLELQKQKGWKAEDKAAIHSNRYIESTNVYGNNIRNSSNAIFVYDSRNVEDSKYIYESYVCKSAYDQTYCDNPLGYECLGGNSYHTLFSLPVGGSDLLYCMPCFDCEHLFGCVGLRNKSYCVLNKQYSPKEYDELVARIIEKMKTGGERGEFFAPSLSYFGYNETVASEFFPMTREEVLARGYQWQDTTYDPVISSTMGTLSGDQIPTDASIVSDEILKKIFVCEVSGRPFKIIKQELDFYRKHKLPLPRKHPDIRHLERMHMRPERELYLRHCDNCGIEMLSVYKEESGFRTYCEDCYNKEIYG